MKALLSTLILLMLSAALGGSTRAAVQSIDDRVHHLGVAGQPEWDIFQGHTPESDHLEFQFESHRNLREQTLFIRQEDVKQDWTVKLNGKRLGSLFPMETDLIHTLPIPPDTLRDGTNELSIATKAREDILIRGIVIGDDSKEKLLSAGPITVTVRESGRQDPIPCRLTIVNQSAALAPIFDYGNTNLATRPGVIYTASGVARFKLFPGSHTIIATRGPEYSPVVVTNFDPQAKQTLDLTLNRSADTRGWVSCDTHIHTLTLSRHGDALLSERVITLAGEAIELPVSTEHNLHADYQPTAAALGLEKYFTLVRGNEVTTGQGHFNIFPVETNSTPPSEIIASWPDLFKAIRSTPRVQVLILNHPTDTHSGFTPFAATNLNLVTGKNLRGDFPFTVDAMEVINSGAMRSDWMEPFRAWFALLNRGYKIVGVGASDSHDVSRFIVGQGRTYIRVDDSDVAHIDIDKACAALKNGQALASLGLIARMTISDGADRSKIAGPGDLLSPTNQELNAHIIVDAPLAPNKSPKLVLYANGTATEELSLPRARGTHHEVTIPITRPVHDTHYVLIATIDFDPAPEWGLARPYQPTSRHFELRLIGAINPIWVDADRDGKFSSARDYARVLLSKKLPNSGLFEQLSTFDYSVAAQCAELLDENGQNLQSEELLTLLAKSDPEIRRGFEDYQSARKK
jgi:hypothetical protein